MYHAKIEKDDGDGYDDSDEDLVNITIYDDDNPRKELVKMEQIKFHQLKHGPDMKAEIGVTILKAFLLNDGLFYIKINEHGEAGKQIKNNSTEGGGRRKKKTRKYKGDKYPYKNITKKEAIADFIKLKTTTNPRSLNGLEIVNYGTEKLRVRTKYRGKSLIERWKDKKQEKP